MRIHKVNQRIINDAVQDEDKVKKRDELYQNLR